jgi:predicted lipoprotein with Yx(FWY)xxD motif
MESNETRSRPRTKRKGNGVIAEWSAERFARTTGRLQTGERRMSVRPSRVLFPAIAIVSLALVAAACGGANTAASPTSTPTTSATASGATVGTVKDPQLGTILVDAKGRTLYLFEKDQGVKSSCYGGCASVWPPLTTSGKPQAGPGASAALLGTTSRTDGTTQVTYNGHPLYYYVSDTQPGQTSGEGLNQFGAGWDVLSPAGNKIEKSGN